MAAVPRAKARLSEALAQGQALKVDQLKRLFGEDGIEILKLGTSKWVLGPSPLASVESHNLKHATWSKVRTCETQRSRRDSS